jgi:hypothetical protein
MLENVAICVTPSGFRLSAETHPWGWHPRLLHATPPAFRTIEGPTSCRPPRISANLEERTARRSLPATFVGQLSNTKPGLGLKRIGSRFAGSRA